MGLKVSVHTEGFDEYRQALAAICTKAEHAVALQMKKDTKPYVPALTKSLVNRTKVIGNQVVYPGTYARFLYYGKVMVYPETGSPCAPKGETKVVTDRNLVFTQSVHPQAQAFWCEASKAQNLEKWQRTAQEAVIRYGKG